MSQLNIDYFQDEIDRREQDAHDALVRLIGDATTILHDLEAGQQPRSTVSGAILNHQRFMDAERALVQLIEANNTRALLERSGVFNEGAPA